MAKSPVLSRNALVQVLTEVIEALGSESSFAQHDLSLDANGTSSSVWSDESTQRDALGWILKKSFDHILADHSKIRPLAYRFSEEINEKVLLITGRSLVTVSEEDGREAVIEVLRRIIEEETPDTPA